MMLVRTLSIAAVIAAATIFVAPASATPIACSGPQPTGSVSSTGGNTCQLVDGATPIMAVFVYQNAGFDSTLSLPSAGYSSIFQNHVDPFGTTASLNVTPGQLLDFTITNQSGTFAAGDNSSDGVYHAAYRSYADYADFNLPAIDAATLAVLNNNGGAANFTFVAFEDQSDGGDRDYNDLVFAFTNVVGVVPPTTVPEPLTLSIFGAGLIGAAAMRRRKKNA